MIENFNNNNKKRDDAICLTSIVLGIILVIYLATPPYDKIAQIGYIYNNIKYTFNKDLKAENEKIVYLRNKAVYLAKMNNKTQALKHIDDAVEIASGSATNSQLQNLYRDSAKIKLYFSDYKGALNDFLKSGEPDFNDNLALAQLFKMVGNKREAISYCNSIINVDSKAYSGYACLADLYASVGRYDVSIRVYDLYLDRAGTKARALADRSYYKKMMGDIKGATVDLTEAQKISPKITDEITILEEALKPKTLNLPIM